MAAELPPLRVDAVVEAGDGIRVSCRRAGFGGLVVEVYDAMGLADLFHAGDLAWANQRAGLIVAELRAKPGRAAPEAG